MRIQTARAEVRTWEESDAESLARHANNRKVWLNLRDAFPHPYAIGDAREFIRSARAAKPETRFAIAVEGRAAGGIGFTLSRDVERLRRSAVKDGRVIDQMLYAYVVPEVGRADEHGE